MSDQIIDTPSGIQAFRLLAILGRLRLELKGIRFRESTFAYVRRSFPLKGRLARRKWVLEAYEVYLRELGVLVNAESTSQEIARCSTQARTPT